MPLSDNYRPSDDTHLAIINWEKFQSVPTGEDAMKWFKFWRSTLMSRTWRNGRDHHRALMVVLLALAAQYRNRIPNDPIYIGSVGGLDDEPTDGSRFGGPSYTMIDLEWFIDMEFIEVRDGAPGEDGAIVLDSKPRRKTAAKKPKLVYDSKEIGTPFATFWHHYPKKVKREGAWKAWHKLGCDDIADEVIKSVKLHNELGAWNLSDKTGKPNLHPTSFLNERRWEDELEAPVVVNQPRQPGELPDILHDGPLK